jgi:hypothetical protein
LESFPIALPAVLLEGVKLAGGNLVSLDRVATHPLEQAANIFYRR